MHEKDYLPWRSCLDNFAYIEDRIETKPVYSKYKVINYTNATSLHLGPGREFFYPKIMIIFLYISLNIYFGCLKEQPSAYFLYEK